VASSAWVRSLPLQKTSVNSIATLGHLVALTSEVLDSLLSLSAPHLVSVRCEQRWPSAHSEIG